MMHGNRRFNDEQELNICQRYQNGESTGSIAKGLDSKADSIYSIVRRHKIKTRSNRKFSDQEEQSICENYKKGFSCSKIAKQYKCSKKTILNILDKYSIETRKDQRKFSEKLELEICRLYKKEGKSINEIGKELNCYPAQVWKILLRHKVNTRSSGESRKRKSWKLSKTQIKDITRRYQDGESANSLSKEYGVDSGSIVRILRWEGLETRGPSERSDGVPKDKYDELVERYENFESAISLSKDYGVGTGAIRTVLLRKNIKIRDLREANKGVPRELHEEICKKYQDGLSGTFLASAYGVKSASAIYSILIENGIERREGGFSDTFEDALNKTNNFINERATSYYIYEIDGFPNYLKFGISFDHKTRASTSEGYYGECLLEKEFETRTHAFFIEQAILRSTLDCAMCPDELLDIGWDGHTEVRKISEEEAITVFDFFEMELEILGLWEFAVLYVPMSQKQKEECIRRVELSKNNIAYNEN